MQFTYTDDLKAINGASLIDTAGIEAACDHAYQVMASIEADICSILQDMREEDREELALLKQEREEASDVYYTLNALLQGVE